MPRHFAPAAPQVALPIGLLLGVQAARDPHHPALSCEDLTLTRAELAARVHRRARAMQAAGVEAGDFVAIALPNGTAFLEVAFAVGPRGASRIELAGAARPGQGQTERECHHLDDGKGALQVRTNVLAFHTYSSRWTPVLEASYSARAAS